MPYTLENLKNFADIQTTISREDPRGTEYIADRRRLKRYKAESEE